MDNYYTLENVLNSMWQFVVDKWWVILLVVVFFIYVWKTK